MPTLYENLLWHLRHTAWLYRSVAIAFAIAVLVLILGYLTTTRGGKEVEEIMSWPLVDALVVESDLRELNTSDDTSFSTKLSVSAKFRYTLSGNTFESNHTTIWARSDTRDWSQIFAVGRTVPLRVSPSDPSNVSLLDLTGAP